MQNRIAVPTGLTRRPCAWVRNAFSRLRSRGVAVPLPQEQPKSLAEFRIEQHMKMVNRALDRIRELNPKNMSRDELPESVWESLAERGERSLIEVVESEVRFWSALTIQGTRIGKKETEWIERVVRLAQIIGSGADRRRKEVQFLSERFLRMMP